jgi:hypothetical protein
MSITLNKDRIASVTSSQFYRLVEYGSRPMTDDELRARPKKGKGSATTTIEDKTIPDSKFFTYVDEKRRELRMKRSISTEVNTRATAWGDLMELMVHALNPIDYAYVSKTTKVHPTIKGFAGSADFTFTNGIAECKGYQPDKFTKYYECLEQKDIELLRTEFPEEYWQIVANSEIHNVEFGEAILYMPYFKDLPKVYETATNYNGTGDIWQFKNICDAIEQERFAELPYLPNDSGYKDLIRFRFKVPQEDKDMVRLRAEQATKEIHKPIKQLEA